MLMNIGMLEEAGTALVDVTNENIQLELSCVSCSRRELARISVLATCRIFPVLRLKP